MNFLNALHKIPTLIDNEHKRIAKEQKDLPVLREVVNTAWKKEDQLKALKRELQEVDKKILAGITTEKKKDEPLCEVEKSDNNKLVNEKVRLKV